MKSATRLQPPTRYQNVPSEKAEGVTYTPENLADFVAFQIVSRSGISSTSKPLKVLDPAIGEGALLVSLLSELDKRGIENLDVYGFETDRASLATATNRISNRFPKAKLHFSADSFLNVVGPTGKQDSLFFTQQRLAFDLIIANPPYVRTQILGSTAAQDLAREYGLTGRVDLYYAFILAIGSVLAAHGTAGVIVSNRFMTTRSGAAVRRAILESLRLRHVWDLGDTKLFDAAVLPAVLLIQSQENVHESPSRFTSIYETRDSASTCVSDPLSALEHDGTIAVRDGRRFRVEQGILGLESREDVWRVANDTSDLWLGTVKANTWGTFADIGKVRVGIKTCGDKIFIRSDWGALPSDRQPELLRPITTHHVARRFKPNWEQSQRKVVYPHVVIKGKRAAADLTIYPKTRAYLEENRDALSSRSYLMQGGRKWYEIWVSQDPGAWSANKLVFRDISEEPTFWMDTAGTVVNGDCYWLTAHSKEQDDLLWLALAVSNSTFIEAFYDHNFHNKLYAGRRRFITQYVERFPLPNPEAAVSRKLIAFAKKIYELTPSTGAASLEQTLDRLVWKAFGVQSKNVFGNGI